MDVEILQRSFNFKMHIDLCNFQMSVTIEKRTVDIALIDLQYGKKQLICVNEERV